MWLVDTLLMCWQAHRYQHYFLTMHDKRIPFLAYPGCQSIPYKESAKGPGFRSTTEASRLGLPMVCNTRCQHQALLKARNCAATHITSWTC